MATRAKAETQLPNESYRRLLSRIAANKSNYWVGFVTDPATAVFFLYWDAAILGTRIIVSIGCYTLGLLSWSLLEYCFHRWIYHQGNTLFHAGHELHHESPKTLIGMPWFLTTVFLWCVWYILGYSLKIGFPLSFIAGLWTGFSLYGAFHHVHHHCDVKQSWYRKLKIHHKIHHQYPNVNFGVTSRLWDQVFGTTYVEKYRKSVRWDRKNRGRRFLSYVLPR